MEPVLEVVDLVKEYPGVRAVDGIGFSIQSGSCFGLLGPNGAGKTTTIEVAEGILAPTSGQVFYRGRPRDKTFQEQIGIQFQSTALLAFLSVRESLETFRRLYRRPRPMAELVRLCQLDEILDRRNDKISGGQRQRLLLAIALANDPQLIFLDEPTTGLDPQARRHLWDIVDTIRREGKTVVLTTHYMDEAQILCDDIAIVDRGRIIARGAPRELLRKHERRQTIEVPRSSLPAGSAGLLKKWTNTGAIIAVRTRADAYELQTDRTNACLQSMLDEGVNLSGITVRSQNLEDLFLELTGRRLRD
jgi:ABC-2 type transport system ATP-binding protein